MKYNFSGWATKNNLKCADGLTIRKGAFNVKDGTRVPLVWNHEHTSPSSILGHAILMNRDEGIFAYGYFNNSQSAISAKESVEHGDVTALSICANHVQKEGDDVVHGVIREVSLVLAGANPGAFIESVINHNEPLGEFEDEAIIYTGEPISLKQSDDIVEPVISHAEGEEAAGKSVEEVLNTLNDEQKAAVGVLISNLDIEDDNKGKGDDNKGKGDDNTMAHNLFEGKNKDPKEDHVLTHDDMDAIMKDAKKLGTLRESIKHHMEEGVLMHAIPTTGFTTPSGTKPTYGVHGIDMLFPEHKSLTPTPEFISRRMEWVDKVISGVGRTPFSRVKSVFADITEDDARARGYIKGKLKKEEVFSILKRVTDPKTVYKKQKMDRDDVIDMSNNMDIIPWLRAEMLTMLREEIARAILIGDGRLSSSDDKISEDHIRPIMNEHDLLSVKVPVKVSATATEEEIANEIIKTMIKSRKQYKGTGNPSLYITDDYVTDMLLIENAIGDRKYKTEAELSTAVRASEIVPVEVMDGQKITISGTQYPLIGIIVNLRDYNVGTDRKGEVTWFDDFDIDYNQMIYLVETRMSGALIKPYSALVFYLDKAAASSGGGA